jgi:hypothetical protein
MEETISRFITQDATLVMVGSWNLAILNPKWFADQIMHVPPGTQFKVEMAVGPTLQLRATIDGLIFIPAIDRVIMAPREETDELIRLVDNAAVDLYKKLPYTPIEAVGYNFTYELEEHEAFSGVVDFRTEVYEEVYKKLDCKSASTSTMLHSIQIGDEPGLLNLTYKIAEGRKALVLNYHHPVEFSAEKINSALGKFYANYQHSKLVSSILITKAGE